MSNSLDYTFQHTLCFICSSVHLSVINLIGNLFVYKIRYPYFPIHLWLTMKMDTKHKLSDQDSVLCVCE